jgi:hypothetical protein
LITDRHLAFIQNKQISSGDVENFRSQTIQNETLSNKPENENSNTKKLEKGRNKNEDDESGVESDELNKSIEAKISSINENEKLVKVKSISKEAMLYGANAVTINKKCALLIDTNKLNPTKEDNCKVNKSEKDFRLNDNINRSIMPTRYSSIYSFDKSIRQQNSENKEAFLTNSKRSTEITRINKEGSNETHDKSNYEPATSSASSLLKATISEMTAAAKLGSLADATDHYSDSKVSLANADSSLNKLRKKDTLLNSKKTLDQEPYCGSNLANDYLTGDNLNRSDKELILLAEQSKQVDYRTKKCQNNHTSVITQIKDRDLSEPPTNEHTKCCSNAQKQLKVYIESLECKLKSLKDEMRESSALQNENEQQQQSQMLNEDLKVTRERSESSESNDSLKEISMNNGGIIGNEIKSKIYNEFLLRRQYLEKQQELQQIKNMNFKLNKQQQQRQANSLDSTPPFDAYSTCPDKFSDEHEKLFFEMQKDRQNTNHLDKLQPSHKNTHKNELDFENESTSSIENPDLDSLKKSMHKGSSTELLFFKMEKEPSSTFKKMGFSPIGQQQLHTNEPNLDKGNKSLLADNKLQIDSKDKDKLNDYNLINPIPIRLSNSSSSFESASVSNKPQKINNTANSSNEENYRKSSIERLDNEVQNNFNNFLTGSLKVSHSKIWKPAQKNTWSSILMGIEANNDIINSNKALFSRSKIIQNTDVYEPTNNNLQNAPLPETKDIKIK